jgi:hypothetical protein
VYAQLRYREARAGSLAGLRMSWRRCMDRQAAVGEDTAVLLAMVWPAPAWAD